MPRTDMMHLVRRANPFRRKAATRIERPSLPKISPAQIAVAVDQSLNLTENDSRQLRFPDNFLHFLQLAIQNNLLSEDQQYDLVELMNLIQTLHWSFVRDRRNTTLEGDVRDLATKIFDGLDKTQPTSKSIAFEEVGTDVGKFVDADIPEFFKLKSGFGIASSDAYLNPNCAEIDIDVSCIDVGAIRISYLVLRSYSPAADALEAFLSTISLPLGHLFPQGNESNERDCVKIVSESDRDCYFGLYICHNVFFRVRSLSSYLSQNHKIVASLAEDFFDHVNKSVKTEKDIRVPQVKMESSETIKVELGQTFEVPVEASDSRYYYQAYSDAGLFSFIEAEATKTGYIFTFSADMVGTDTIVFCFAHHMTMNLLTIKQDVTIYEPDEPDEPDTDPRGGRKSKEPVTGFIPVYESEYSAEES